MIECRPYGVDRGIIQRYGNICNHENEYAREVCLICPPNGPVECMPLPSVSHQRNKYSVVQKNGIKYILQHYMGMQDFRKVCFVFYFFSMICFVYVSDT